MNEPAGDCMVIPSELGLGAGTKEPGDGTCSCGLPGEPAARMLPGDGVPMKVEGEGVTPDILGPGEAGVWGFGEVMGLWNLAPPPSCLPRELGDPDPAGFV